MITKSFDTRAKQLIDDFANTQKSHSNFLILTIFGDFINAHGGTIWLGSLIKMVAGLGINQRLVRTSVFRLTEKGILQSNQVGRRSFYSLTEKGYRQSSTAAERIYRYHESNWDSEWRLVFTTLQNISLKKKERFQNELIWLGFNRLSNGVYAHPIIDIELVNKIVTEMNLNDSVVVMRAASLGDNPLQSSANMIKYCFNFDVMKKENEEFINFFNPILDSAQASDKKSDELCFLIRSLLIHKYRRILLGEPELPHELIPEDCLNHRTRDITEKLYKLICHQAENYFLEVGEGVNGQLPDVTEEFFTRFGGIPR